MTTPPRIAITAGFAIDHQPYGTVQRVRVTANYASAITAAGGIPIILPPQKHHLAALMEMVDGLLLTGGADINPARYGTESVHAATYDVDDLRDTFEFSLATYALEHRLPLLCICRGIQVLNVALGGTLYQDLPDQYAGALQHRQHLDGIPTDMPAHRLDVRPNSLLAEVYGGTEIDANSLHHQAIKDLAGDLVVDAWAPDGVIEAVSYDRHPFALAVQWHLELMYERHAAHLAPFKSLVTAAARAPLAPMS